MEQQDSPWPASVDGSKQAALQPLFDSSVSLPQDTAALAPEAASSPPGSGSSGSNLFGRLPEVQRAAVAAGSAAHSRTASYGTSLLDTLNEEKQQRQQQQRTGPPQPPPPTSGSGMLGAHARLSSLSSLATSSPAHARLSSLSGMATSSPAASGLLAASALRSSYSSNSLRSAFARRSPPPGASAAQEFTQALDEGVWGPSGLSSELDILGSAEGVTEAMGRMALGHVRGSSISGGSVGPVANDARLRSYSFNSPPAGDEADIDSLHAAARAQNPALAFRRMVARTHARSKTLASPLGAGGRHSRQASGDGDVHIGIGGAGAAAMTSPPSAAHSRQPSMHRRNTSVDVDDGVPTRSLWVGNVDPGLGSQDLVAIFGRYGRVESLRLLPDKECAFVNFLRVEDAMRAKEDMAQGAASARIGGSSVRVGYGKGESYATGDAQAMQPTRALWIGNIAPSGSPERLASVFQQFGAIESARVLNHKNCGFVNFERLEDAVRAKQAMNGKSVDGAVVRIGYAKVPAAKSDAALKLRNPVPSAAPLTASGQRAEDDAVAGTTQRGLGSDAVLEPGFSLAIDEDLVAFPYATRLPPLPPPGPGQVPPLSRLRELRRQLDAGMSRDDLSRMASELLPFAVELCTDYVGNVLIQRIAERAEPALRLELCRRVCPHMAAVGVHKNGTWAVQKILDSADTPEQRQLVVRHLRPYTPQLLLDQLGNYVVQCCLRFGPPPDDEPGADADGARAASNQFIFDAIHARCQEIAYGRFGARAVRTCLESQYASRMQQKLVAVALVTNAAALATNANGHLLMTWLLDSSRFTGRYRVLAHQLAPHLRYLATHRQGSSTVAKLVVDQTQEPDARDLILNTLFFNPDPSVLDDVLLDHLQGVHLALRILHSESIGDAEKARIADRIRPVIESPSFAASLGEQRRTPSVSPPAAGRSREQQQHQQFGSAAQRLVDLVSSILEHSQPVYPPAMLPAAHRGTITGTTTAAASPPPSEPMPAAQHFQPLLQQQQQQQQISLGFHPTEAMSFPTHQMPPPPPPAGFTGMTSGLIPPEALAYYQQAAGMMMVSPPAGFFGMPQGGLPPIHPSSSSSLSSQPLPPHSAMPLFPPPPPYPSTTLPEGLAEPPLTEEPEPLSPTHQ